MDQNSRSDLTLKEEIDEVKKRPGKAGFFISDVPLHVLKDFMGDVKDKYNDIYWVKLMDLMRKSNAYDMFISQEEYEVPEKEEKKEVKIEGVRTFGGIQN